MYAATSGLTALHGQRTKQHTVSPVSISPRAGHFSAWRDGGRFFGGQCKAGCDRPLFCFCRSGDDSLCPKPDRAVEVLAFVRGNTGRIRLEPLAAGLVSHTGMAPGVAQVSGFSIPPMDQPGSEGNDLLDRSSGRRIGSGAFFARAPCEVGCEGLYRSGGVAGVCGVCLRGHLCKDDGLGVSVFRQARVVTA